MAIVCHHIILEAFLAHFQLHKVTFTFQLRSISWMFEVLHNHIRMYAHCNIFTTILVHEKCCFNNNK